MVVFALRRSVEMSTFGYFDSFNCEELSTCEYPRYGHSQDNFQSGIHSGTHQVGTA